MPGLTFLVECALMFLLLCMLLVVTYHMTKSSSQLKSSIGRYGSVESTALHSETAADDASKDHQRLPRNALKD